MHRVLTFIKAVSDHWGSLVTGGVAIGFIGTYQGTGHAVPAWVYWTIAGIAVVVAFYRAWLDQFLKVEALQQEISSPEASQRTMRKQWTELGNDFEVTRTVGSARWVTEGDAVKWSIFSEKLVVLCAVAGTKLIKSPHIKQTLSSTVLSESDPMFRWLLYVREKMPRAWAVTQMDWQTAHLNIPNEGEIRAIANTCALVCIKCSAEEE